MFKLMKSLFLCTAALTVGSGAALAQGFPSKTVRLISGVTPGSASDTMARIVAEKLTSTLGQSVIVENWLGAGGLVGASRVAKSDPDGHTIMVYASALTVAPLINPGVLDPKDLTQLLPNFDWDKLKRTEPIAVRALLEKDGVQITNAAQLREIGVTNFVIKRAQTPVKPPTPEEKQVE